MATPPATTQLNLFGQPAAVNQGPGLGQSQNSGLGLSGQPSQQNTSLFGQQTQTTATSSQQKSLFGGNFSTGGQTQMGATGGQQASTGFNQGATGQQSLFGQPFGQQKPVQVNVSLGQAPATTSLFGQAAAAPSSNLFGQPAQTSLFSSNQPTSGLFGTQQPSSMQPLQPQQMMPQAFVTNDEQKAQSEVMQLINVYQSSVDGASDKNRFRGCLFNKVGRGVAAQHQKFLQQNIPLAIGNTPVDQHKWIQAMEANPNKTQLVPTQISSVSELKERTMTVLKAVQDAKQRLQHAKERLEVVEKSCDSDIQKTLESTYERNKEIKKRLCQVFGKFEGLLTEQGRVQVDKSPQEDLIAHQRELLRKLCGPQTGLLHQIDQAKRQSHQALVLGEEFRGSDTFDGKVDGKEMDKQLVADADLRDILRVLKQQKQGIETLQRSVRDSASQIIVMEKEINI